MCQLNDPNIYTYMLEYTVCLFVSDSHSVLSAGSQSCVCD